MNVQYQYTLLSDEENQIPVILSLSFQIVEDVIPMLEEFYLRVQHHMRQPEPAVPIGMADALIDMLMI